MAIKKPVPKTAKSVAKPGTKKSLIAKKPIPPKKAPAKKAAVGTSVNKSITKKNGVVSKPVKAKESLVKKTVKTKSDMKQLHGKIKEKVTEQVSTNKKPAAENKKPAASSKKESYKEVKVPKTSVKTSVPYQPEYKSLEQRREVARNNEPLIRYTDTDLNEFKELINKKLEAAKKELNYLQGLITRKDDMGGDESENRYMTMEDGSISMEREQLSQMASRQITYIDHLEKALIRIENKTYGICRVSGLLIDKARLRAVPHATLSLEAKLGLVKSHHE